MNFFENIIILEIFGCFVLELFNIRSSTKSFCDFAEQKYDFHIIWSFMTPNSRWNVCSHLKSKSIEVRGAIQINIPNFIFNFCLNFVETNLSIEGCESSLDLSHILLNIVRNINNIVL